MSCSTRSSSGMVLIATRIRRDDRLCSVSPSLGCMVSFSRVSLEPGQRVVQSRNNVPVEDASLRFRSHVEAGVTSFYFSHLRETSPTKSENRIRRKSQSESKTKRRQNNSQSRSLSGLSWPVPLAIHGQSLMPVLSSLAWCLWHSFSKQCVLLEFLRLVAG